MSQSNCQLTMIKSFFNSGNMNKRGSYTVASGVDCCCYQRHSCSRPRYLNYKHCSQHIVEDQQSPYTSCEYLSRTTGRKCPNPALRPPRKQNSLPIFCTEHLHELNIKEQHQKQKRKLRRKRKSQKASLQKAGSSKNQKLVNKLYKYCEGAVKTQSHDTSSDSETEEVHRPIKDDWLLENSASFDTDANWDDFDAVNNEVYEPLRYADVLTSEEVVATAQSKLIRLQSLYIEQFKRLSHLLKEKRRYYLEERKKEIKEEKSIPGIRRNMEYEVNDEINALARCGRRTGVEALLRKRQLQKREQADSKHVSLPAKSTTAQRCTHISNHTRCKSLCLPYTKYCYSHILEDPHQLLYRKCHMKNCPIPVLQLTATSYSVPTDDGSDEEDIKVNYCIIHAPLPEMTFDFPDIVKSPEKMEVCDNMPEDKSTELSPGTSAIHPRLADNLSPISDVDGSHAISNEIQHLAEETAQSLTMDIKDMSDDIEKRLADNDVSYTMKREPFSQEYGDAQDFSPVKEQHLDSGNVLLAIKPEPSSQDCADVHSRSRPDISTTGGAISDVASAYNEESQTNEATTKTTFSEDIYAQGGALQSLDHSGGSLDNESVVKHSATSPEHVDAPRPPLVSCAKMCPAPHSLASKDDPKPERMLVDSEDNVTDGNVPSAVKDRSESSDRIAPLITANLTHCSSMDSKENLTNEDVPNAAKSTTSLHDLAGKKDGEQRSDESAQLCEMTGMFVENTMQASSSVLKVAEESGNDDKDSFPSYTSEESGRKDPKSEKKQPKGVLKSPQPGNVPKYISERGERKPSSAEEEMAVVSLLQLCSGHPSDDTTSSSAEQE